MKNTSKIITLLLLLIVCLALLIYPFTQNWPLTTPVLAAILLLVLGIFIVLIGATKIASSPKQQKTIEPEPQTPAIETPKTEPAPEPQPAPQPPQEQKPEPQIQPQSEPQQKEPQPTQPQQETENKTTQTPTKETSGIKVINIEGIGPVYAQKLSSINIHTTDELLTAGATPHGRKEITEKTGISNTLILKWVNSADLFRIKGVGEEYSNLLEEAGVDTVVELAQRVPEHLHAKLLEVNEQKKLVRRPPALKEVTLWIQEAKALPRKIEY